MRQSNRSLLNDYETELAEELAEDRMFTAEQIRQMEDDFEMGCDGFDEEFDQEFEKLLGELFTVDEPEDDFWMWTEDDMLLDYDQAA